jgi:hypothetical protein
MMDDAGAAAARADQREVTLNEQVASLARLVTELQTEIKRYSYKRDYIARIFASFVILSAIIAMIVIQQLSNVQNHTAVVSQCNTQNEMLRGQRNLYTALAAAERQAQPKTINDIVGQQARIVAYTQAANAIRLVDCAKL